MNRGWKRQMTEEAKADRESFETAYGTTGNCNCHTGAAPCGSCVHPGNPLNQDEDDSAWEWISPGMIQKANRREQGMLRLLHHYAHTRATKRIQKANSIGPKAGWGRKAWNRAKLELRGTYQRNDRWRLRKSAERVVAAAKSLARSIEAETGKPCDWRDLLRACEPRPLPLRAFIFSTPIANHDTSRFMETWRRATSQPAPAEPQGVQA